MPAHYVLKTKQVKETPVGRQGVNRYLKKQEKLLQNLSSNDITFVEETPEKDSGGWFKFVSLYYVSNTPYGRPCKKYYTLQLLTLTTINYD